MILDEFYEVIMARTTKNVPEIKHIDQYMGQYDNPEVDDKGNPLMDDFMRPALFVQFPPTIGLKPLSMRRKTAEFIWSAHLVQDVIQDISRRTPANIRALNHKHMQLIDKFQLNFEGFNGNMVTSGFNQFDAIAWESMNPYIFNGAQIIHILNFRVKLTSDNARIKYTRLDALPTPIVAVDIVDHEMDDLNPDTV